MLKDSKAKHCLKASLPISSVKSGTVKDVSNLQLKNAFFSIFFTLGGTKKVFSDVHPINVPLEITETDDEKVTLLSIEQSANAYLLITFTESGMITDLSDEHFSNAKLFMILNEFGMFTVESEEHSLKAAVPIVSTKLGNSILLRETHPMKIVSLSIVRFLGNTTFSKDVQSINASLPVSYTHLTLPTTPYV